MSKYFACLILILTISYLVAEQTKDPVITSNTLKKFLKCNKDIKMLDISKGLKRIETLNKIEQIENQIIQIENINEKMSPKLSFILSEKLMKKIPFAIRKNFQNTFFKKKFVFNMIY
jgi:hypothetical protein